MSYPAWGTAPIQCGKRGCGWRGYETDLAAPRGGFNIAYSCPTCGHGDYQFLTPKQITAWERAKAAASQANEGTRNA